MNQGFRINEGDLVKLGRVKYRVRELKGALTLNSNKNGGKNEAGTKIEDESPFNEGDSQHKKSLMIESLKDPTTGTSFACRICLSEYPEPGNPFLSPCSCAGTMKYIHVKCLQKWLKSKLHTK